MTAATWWVIFPILRWVPLKAIFAGFLELMMRERAGLPRPTFSRVTNPKDWPPPTKDPEAKPRF